MADALADVRQRAISIKKTLADEKALIERFTQVSIERMQSSSAKEQLRKQEQEGILSLKRIVK